MAAYPDYCAPNINKNNCDQVLEKNIELMQKAMANEAAMKEQSSQVYCDGDIKERNHNKIKEAYKEKINSYYSLLNLLETHKKKLIDTANNKKDYSMNDVLRFMASAEKIGIDEMNHKTIIEMLSKQYKEWFGKLPDDIMVTNKYSNLEVL